MINPFLTKNWLYKILNTEGLALGSNTKHFLKISWISSDIDPGIISYSHLSIYWALFTVEPFLKGIFLVHN